MIDTPAGLPGDLLSLTAAAKLLPGREPGKHLHVATLWRWTTEGKLPAWRIGGCVYVSRADVLGLARPVQGRKPQPAMVRTESHRLAVEKLRARGLEVG